MGLFVGAITSRCSGREPALLSNIQYTTNLISFSFLNHFLQAAQDTTSIRRAKFGWRNVN